MFKVGDYVEHKDGYSGIIMKIVSRGTIAIKRDDGEVGIQIPGCFTVDPMNLTLIPSDLENE